MDEPRPHDDAGNDAPVPEVQGYSVAPLPETFAKTDSPAYRPEPSLPDADTYAVGPEVDAPSLSVGSNNWREAATGVHRQADEFDVIEEPSLPSRQAGQAALRRAIERSQALRDAVQAGSLEDPARFSLRSLFLLLTAASVALAFGSRLPRPVFAGVSGAAAFLTLIAAKWMRGGSAAISMAWYTLLFIYLLASVFAALGL